MLSLPLPVCLGLEKLEEGGPQQRQGERVHYDLRFLPPHPSATPSLSLSGQSRTQNKEASKLLPSPPPQTSLLSGVLYEVIKREYFSGVSWVPGASQWPSKPRRGGNRGVRWEVLAQAHTAGSGEARMLISVSWLLPIPFPKKGERSNGASSPSGTCIAPWLS